MKIHLATTVLAVCLLSACATKQTVSFEEFIDQVESLGEEGENLQEVDPDDLPDSATMTGYFAVGIDDEDFDNTVFIGNAEATANFQSGALNGTAEDFVEFEGNDACFEGVTDCEASEVREIDGSLDIAGTITGAEFEFTAQGTLTADANNEEEDLYLDLAGDGAFGTVDGNLVALGLSEGTATNFDDDDADAQGVLILED